MKKLFALLMLSTLSISIFAQAGTIDSLFGVDGHILVPKMSYTFDLLELNDGSVLLSGMKGTDDITQMSIAKYTIDGVPVGDFGDNGSVVPSLAWNSSGFNIEAYDADRFMVMGHGDNAVTDIDITVGRFYNDGSVDSTFGENGFVRIDGVYYGIGIIVLENKNLILTYGITEDSDTQKLSRLLPDGSFDMTFGDGGTLDLPLPSDVTYFSSPKVLLHNGKLLFGGSMEKTNVVNGLSLLQLNTDGTLDNTFGENGLVFIEDEDLDFDEEIDIFKVLEDGKIHVAGVLAGSQALDTNYIYTTQLLANGTIDESYGQDGVSTIPLPSDLGNFVQVFATVIQPDGKIVIVGNLEGEVQFTSRLNANGTLDEAYGGVGLVSAPGFSVLRSLEYLSTFGANLKLMSDKSLWTLGAYYDEDDEPIAAITKYKLGLISGVHKVTTQQISISVSPNPVQEILGVQYELKETNTVRFVLRDLAGKVVHDFGRTQSMKGQNKQSLVLPENISSGNYLLTLDGGDVKSSLLITVK